MPSFHFKALQLDDVVIEGDMEANVPQDVYREMEFHGLLPISVSLAHAELENEAPSEVVDHQESELLATAQT